MLPKYICFDTETSGLDPTINNLLTACFIVLDKNLNEINRLNISLKYDNYNVNVNALEINNINIQKHHNDIMSIDRNIASEILVDFLKEYTKYTVLIPIGHNVHFDIGFIKKNLLLEDEYNKYLNYNYIDTKVIANFLKLTNDIPEDYNTSLSSLCNFFEIKSIKTEYHSAEFDTEMTIKLLHAFFKIKSFKKSLKFL
jgi:DNA polymerase III alpha subunit (gram-positive type)